MKMGLGSAVLAAAALMLPASPAIAGNDKVKETPAPPACAGFMDNFSTTASDCRGFFDKNALGGNEDMLLIQEQAIEQLLGISIPDGTFGPEDYTKVEGPSDDTSFDFAQALLGPVVIGFHFGGANGQANNVGNATGFFLFDFDQPTWNLTTNIPGFSAYILYNPNTPPPPSVPEPATWAMMLMGFGAAGTAMRRRRKAIAQIA